MSADESEKGYSDAEQVATESMETGLASEAGVSAGNTQMDPTGSLDASGHARETSKSVSQQVSKSVRQHKSVRQRQVSQ